MCSSDLRVIHGLDSSCLTIVLAVLQRRARLPLARKDVYASTVYGYAASRYCESECFDAFSARKRDMAYRIGIDTGSKTIKVAVLDDSGELVCSRYLRHRSDIRTTMADVLHDMVWRHGDLEGSVAVTGSAGIAVAEMLDLPFVQEVVATTRAVQDAFPQADCVIELGGEDAKVIYLTGGLEQRMNATCAGGTGGFIDTIAFMLGVSSRDMGRLSLGASRTYPIASRCAVFAQTDVRPLLNAGASKSDIAASALEAVVRQTLGGLACGRPLQGTVVLASCILRIMAGRTCEFSRPKLSPGP